MLITGFDAPIEQVRQVINYYHIHPGDLDPLTRCSRCNTLLCPVERRHYLNAVPDYIRQNQMRFMMCVQCGRIYWPGSHGARMADLFESWFSSGAT